MIAREITVELSCGAEVTLQVTHNCFKKAPRGNLNIFVKRAIMSQVKLNSNECGVYDLAAVVWNDDVRKLIKALSKLSYWL